MQFILKLFSDKSCSLNYRCCKFIAIFLLFMLFLLATRAMATIWLDGNMVPDTPMASSADGYYGYSVDIDGNYAIVGAWGHDVFQDNSTRQEAGRVWILEKTNGVWTREQSLELTRTEEAIAHDQFGTSVAISGDYAVVGTPGEDYSYNRESTGAVFVFHKNGNSWDQMQKITACYTAYDRFGHSVDIHGNYLIVGAQNADAAYIYELQENTWQLKSVPTVSNSGTLGSSVAISDGYAIIGDPTDDINGDSAGAAHIWKRNDATGLWDRQIPALYPNGPWSPQQLDRFGISVSIDGDYAIVGANPPDRTGADGLRLWQGTAYIFKRDDNGTWPQLSGYLHANDSDPGGNNFGGSVSISGRYAVVGASGDNDRGTNAGAAFFYEITEDDWHYKEKFVLAQNASESFMGASVATDKGNFLIGAPDYGDNVGAVSTFSFDFDDDFDIDGLDLNILITKLPSIVPSPDGYLFHLQLFPEFFGHNLATIEIIEQTASLLQTNASMSLSAFTVSDDVAVLSAQESQDEEALLEDFRIEEISWVASNGQTGLATGEWEWQINGIRLNFGTNVINLVVTDAFGNIAEKEIQVVYDGILTEDRTRPPEQWVRRLTYEFNFDETDFENPLITAADITIWLWPDKIIMTDDHLTSVSVESDRMTTEDGFQYHWNVECDDSNKNILYLDIPFDEL